VKQAERLPAIINELRTGHVRRAMDLRNALGVTERTIYRDIDRLRAAGVPIEGEAGFGYLLRRKDWSWPPKAETTISEERA